MKTKKMTILIALLSLLGGVAGAVAQGTAFTYQGRLTAGGQAAHGIYDLRFSIYDLAEGDTPLAGPITNSAVSVSNGLFTVTLDFGVGIFGGESRWLAIAVRTNGGGAFSPLAGRQPVTPSPYAITAVNVSGAVAASQLTGPLPSANLAGTYSGAVTFNNAANSFSGDGAGLTSLNASQLTAGTVPDARLGTNVALLNSSPTFTGSVTAGGDLAAARLKIGTDHELTGYLASVAGGRYNSNASHFATIGGGWHNSIQTNATAATIAGGNNNTLQTASYHSTIGGGRGNTIGPAEQSTIAGGSTNVIQSGAFRSVIAGGASNLIASNAANSTIGGGLGNMIQPSATSSSIGGGNRNTIEQSANDSTVAGGNQNTIQRGAAYSAIGGGFQNIVEAYAYHASIAGGGQNTIRTNASYSTIGGGQGNEVGTNAYYSVVSGGISNLIHPRAERSAIGGGQENSIEQHAGSATIGGGGRNTIQADADYSTIGGGRANTIHPGAFYGAIGGGYSNVIGGDAQYATIPGGDNNWATSYALAAGHRAKAGHWGTFVWADSQDADFASTGNNQFLIRASGGVGINKTNPATALDVNGTVTATAFVGTGASLTGLNATNLASGTVPDARLSTNVALRTGGNAFTGTQTIMAGNVGIGTNNPQSLLHVAGAVQAATFQGNGSGLTGLDANQLGSGTVPDARLSANVARTNQVWLLSGNSGTAPGTHFLGTTDNQPLEVRVNGLRAIRLVDNGDGSDEDDIPDGAPNVILGAPNNWVASNVVGATISGGGAINHTGFAWSNTIRSDYASIGGGFRNTIEPNAGLSTIGGGNGNTIQSNANHATIGGGGLNTIGGSDATIGGGSWNTIRSGANHATIGGGYSNTIQFNAAFATIPGGQANSATNYAFAAGHRAKANHTGAFVWADSQDADFASTGTNQFLIRASGGVGIGTTSPTRKLQVNDPAAGALTYPAKISNDAGDTNNTVAGVLFQVSSGGDRGKGALVYERTETWNRGKFHFLQNSNANANIVGMSDAVMTIANNGNVGIGTTNPGARLEVAGSVRLGTGGTIIPRIQAGTIAVGPGTPGVNVRTNTFPVPFSSTPKVIVSARGEDYADTFAVTARAVTTNGFKLNILRLDENVAWGQNLQVDWIAWE